MKHGKKYREKVKTYDKQQVHPVEKGVELVKSCAFAKFDETVELAMKLNIKTNQSIRDTLVFPHQFGKEKRILVFAKGAKADEAREAGATFVGDDDLIEKIKGGWL
ncbi:MAG: 50S ribosomal protein L1, partial [Spirochaetaceae bacterium]